MNFVFLRRFQIGLMGLVEFEWLATLYGVPVDDLNYVDFVKKGKELSEKLKNEEKCDLVIALTHMRTVFFFSHLFA